jgi:hypothetical protein
MGDVDFGVEKLNKAASSGPLRGDGISFAKYWG